MLTVEYPPGFDTHARGHGYRWPDYRVCGQVSIRMEDSRQMAEGFATLTEDGLSWIHVTGILARGRDGMAWWGGAR
jgi:hypothetical protein